MKLLLLPLLLLCSVFSMAATAGRTFTVRAPQFANSDAIIAGYLADKIYSHDTIHLNDKGYGQVSLPDKLDEGLYLLFFNASRYYEFLLCENQNLELSVSDTTKNAIESFSVHGDPQSEAFINFGVFITQKRTVQAELLNKRRELPENSKQRQKLTEQIDQLNKQVEDYQQDLIRRFDGRTLGLFVKALIEPKFPAELLNSDTTQAMRLRRYEYAKQHFFDNYNLADPRSWRFNQLHRKLDQFLNKTLVQIPDSITPAAIDLIERSRPDSVCFDIMTNRIIDYSVKSKIMGMDMLFAQIAERYYLTHLAYWTDSTLQSNVESEYRKVRFNQLGMTAANLPLRLRDNRQLFLHDVKAPLTLLFFYEPTCGHCQKMTPLVHDIFTRWHDKGFQVVAVYLLQDTKEWDDFMKNNNLYDWINVWDPQRESYYWTFFDTSSTPGLYLLDADKKIIAKKIDAPTLENIVRFKLVDEPAGRPFHSTIHSGEDELPIDLGK